MFQRLLQIITKSKEFITFVVLSVISLSLISAGNVSKIGGYRTIVIATTGLLQNAFSWIPNPGALKSENRALRQLNLQLSSEVTRMRKSMIENEKLRSMIDLKNESEYPLISAEIVGRTSIEMRNFVTLNKGSASGIQRGMTVRTDAGLVGSILSVSENFSMVELIKNRNVRVASEISRTQIDGILIWKGLNEFIMKNVPNTYDVQTGDIVLTSNYSNRFPADIPIGQVTAVSDEPGTLFYRIEVKSFVDFSILDQVFVITYLPDPERIELIEEVEEKLRGLR